MTEKGKDCINMKNLRPVPKFKSIKEEALFWDDHDLTDYFDFSKMKRVRFVLEKPKKRRSLTIRLPDNLIDKIEKRAESLGLSLSSLARMWFVEKLSSV